MPKKVVYNGQTCSYYGASDPSVLRIGGVYEVLGTIDRGWQTDYVLAGIKGHFNSVWFNPVGESFLAISYELPIKGKSFRCKRIRIMSDKVEAEEFDTSPVKMIKFLGNSIYVVKTENNIYFVNVVSGNSFGGYKTYLATSHEVPIMGRPLHCNRLNNKFSKLIVEFATTTEIKQVMRVSDDTYICKTMNSIYLVKVDN